MHRPLLLLLLVFYHSVCIGQATSNSSDSLFTNHNTNKTKWLTIGVNYDVLNSLTGAVISNGLDEAPLIHFEDIPADLLYKLQGQTDFRNDYTFGAKLSLNKFLVFRRLWFPSIEYLQKSINSNNLFQRELNLSSIIGLNYFGLLAKAGYQKLNSQINFGIGAGLEKSFYRRFYTGFIISYYFDYITYSAFLQGFLVRGKISMRLSYDKIDKYDFLNIGVHLSIKK